jgi:hypothetical protein
MRRTNFRPEIDRMEPRIALSSGGFFGSLEDAVKSILGQSTSSSSKSDRPTKAQIAHAQAVKLARQEKLAAWYAAHPHVHHAGVSSRGK